MIECVLSDKKKFTKVYTKISDTRAINLSIVQGSGVGQCLFIILISDLKPFGGTNHMVKYADDASLLVSETHSVSPKDEYLSYAELGPMI